MAGGECEVVNCGWVDDDTSDDTTVCEGFEAVVRCRRGDGIAWDGKTGTMIEYE